MSSDLSGKASRNHHIPMSKRQKRVEGSSPARSRHMPKPQVKNLETLFRVSVEILGFRELKDMLQRVTDAARELTGARLAKTSYGYSDSTFSIDAHSFAENTPACPAGLSFQVNRGGVYLELIHQTPTLRLTSRQLENHSKWWGLPEGHVPLRGFLGARITDAQNAPYGMVLVSDKTDGQEFTAEDEHLLDRLAAIGSMALQHLESRQHAEHQQQHLQAVVDNIADGVIGLSSEGMVISMNPAARAMFEFENDAVSILADKFFQQFDIHDENGHPIDHAQSPCRRVLRGERLTDWIVSLRNKTTQRSWAARFGGMPITDNAGEILFGVLTVSDITRDRQIRQRLHESEQRLHRVLAGSNDGYWEWDLVTDLIETSPRWLEIIGYQNRDLTFGRKNIENLIHPEDLPVIKGVINKLKQGDTSIARREFENRIRHRDGYYVYIHIRGKVTLRDTEGRPLRASGTITDISDRVRAQEMLRINEEIALERLTEIEMIYKNAPVGLCVLDTELRFVRLNERFSRITGIPVSGHIGRTMADIIPEIAVIAEPIMQRVFSNGTPVPDIEIKGTSVIQPGKSRYWLSHFYPIFNTEDEITGLNVVFEEITERKHAEQTARRRAAELEAIMDNVPAFVMISRDPDGHHITGNRASHELVHLPPGTNLSFTAPENQRPGQFKIVRDGKEIPYEDLPLQQAARHGRYIRDAEMEMVFIDGRSRTLFGNAAPILDDSGNSQGAVGAFIDITERKHAESQLKDINTTLEHRVRERTSQLESVNADLKRRAGQLQVLALKLSEAEDKERRRLAELLHDDLQQLLAAAKLQLGQLSELSSGNQKFEQILEQVDRILSDSVRKTRNLSHELSPSVLSHEGLVAAIKWMGRQMETKHGLSVEIESEDNAEPATHPLRTFYYKAANEILFNVVKHAGTDAAHVSISRNSGNIEMTVSDRGKGFDPERVRVSGYDSGFGLFSIREHAKMLGGRLHIESTPGRGSRFVLSLPDPEAGKSGEQGTGLHSGAHKDSDRLFDRNREMIKVLVVDDHRMMREGLSSMLAKQPDIEIVGQAENGKQAIDKVRLYHPDVVLMDVSMPVMNGIEATSRIKDQWPNTCVIALSMYDEPDIHVAMIEAGAATYLNKTGPSETLLSVVRDHSPAFSA